MSFPITFTGRGVDVTEAIRTYIEEKLQKVPHFEMSTQVNVEVGKTIFNKGSEKDFYIRLLITLPKAIVRIKKEGSDVYALVDDMIPSLSKKMVQYKENFRKWEGAETWPETAVTEDMQSVGTDDSTSAIYASYTPKVRRKILSEMVPMSVTEAIERMELLDKEYFVFKDVQSGKIAVVVRKKGEYEMVVAD